MPTFEYVAKDMQGRTMKGTLELSSRAVLMQTLRERALVLISLNEQADQKLVRSRKTVKLEEMVVFSRQLATMIESGIPLVQSLEVLGSQVQSKDFCQIIQQVRDDVETGSSLSEALLRHPKAFSELYVSMVQAGESSGQLDEIFDRLATYLEKTNALRRKVQASLVYPALVTIVAALITTGLLVFVIPQFKDIFESLGGELPAPTQFLLNVSNLLRQRFLLMAGLGTACFFGLNAYRTKTYTGRKQWDQLLLGLPVFGELFQKVAVARFARTLATLVRSGVAILASLEIVGKTSGNVVIEEAVTRVRSSIREGEKIAEPLAASKVFPPMVVRMIGVGEETGELEKMLTKIADFYEEEVDAAVSGLTSLIEPLVIAVLGVIIGGIVICLFLPIFKLTQVIAK